MQEEITDMVAVSSTFRQFVSVFTGKESFPHLRFLTIGGEVVNKQDVELYKRHFSDNCILVHALASMETGNYHSFLIDKQTEITGSLVPMGYAVEDREALLLDDDGR